MLSSFSQLTAKTLIPVKKVASMQLKYYDKTLITQKQKQETQLLKTRKHQIKRITQESKASSYIIKRTKQKL